MADIPVLVATGGMLVTLVFNLLSSRRNARQDSRQSATELTTITIKLENISNDIKEIKSELKSVSDDVKELRERVVVVEQSAKQAHRRLDEHIK